VFNNISSFNLISIPFKSFSTQNAFLNNQGTSKKSFSENLENKTKSEILQQQTQTQTKPQKGTFTLKKPASFNATNIQNPNKYNNKNSNNTNNNNPNTKYFENLHNSYLADNTYHETYENKFDIFLDKTQKLMENELARREKNTSFASELRQISLNSKEPLRDLLVHYQSYRNENGFDAEAVSEAILVLGKANASRSRFHKCYSDMSHWEFINSTRLYHLIDDVKFAVVNSLGYLNGEQFCRIIRGLKLCGYKNTQLAQLIQTRLASIVLWNESLSSGIAAEEERSRDMRYADFPGVGKKDFLHLNPYATDIQLDKNVLGYFGKLLKMKFNDDESENVSSENSSFQATNSINSSFINSMNNINSNNNMDNRAEDEKSQELRELETNIQSIIDLTQDARDLQLNFTDNLSNVVDQYFKFEQLSLENPEIRENPYTKHSLQKIQDKLIEMGFIDINTYKLISSKKLSSEEYTKLKSETVIKILRDYIYLNYPDLFAKVLDEIESSSASTQQNTSNEALKLSFTKYRFSPTNLAECLKELSEYAKITDIDVNGEDYEDAEFNLQYYNKEIPEKPIEHIRSKPEYTKMYNTTLEFFKSIKKEMHKKFKNTEDLKYQANLILAYANLHLTSKESLENSNRVCCSILSNDRLKPPQNADLCDLLYAVALSGFDSYLNLMSLILKRFDSNRIAELDFEKTLKALWSLLSFEAKMDDKFFELLKHLNGFDVYNHITEGFTSYDDNCNLFYETTVALREYAKKFKVDERREIADTLYLSSKFFENKSALLKKAELNLIDPLKENMKRIFVEKFYKNKLNLEAKSILKQKQNSLGFEQLTAPFTPDFVLDIYGNKICVFLNSLDKDFKHGFISGQQKIVKNVLEKFHGCTCIFIPISKLISFSPADFSMKFNYAPASGFENLDKMLLGAIAHRKPKVAEAVKALQKLNSRFNKFIANLVNADSAEFELIQGAEPNKENLEIFFKNLLFAAELEAKFMFNCSYAQFGLNLLEFRKVLNALEIVAESLSDNFRKLLAQSLKFEDGGLYTSFKDFLLSLSAEYGKYFDLLQEQKKMLSLSAASDANTNNSNSGKYLLNDENWVGKRLNVDLINSDLISGSHLENLKKKNVAVEILNNNYMWCDEYNPYPDWEEELKAHMDHFNYFATKSQNKFYFNSHKLGSRKVPQGIFPHPSQFRLMKQTGISSNNSLESSAAEGVFNIEHTNANNNAYETEINRFYNLNEILILEEIKKNNLLSSRKKIIPSAALNED